MTRSTVLRGTAAGTLVVGLALAGCSGSPATLQGSPVSAAAAVADDVSAAFDAFFEADYADYFRNRRAVLVSVSGEPVVEQYSGIAAGDRVNVQSVGKSILSSLVGIAIDEGLIGGVDQTLGDLLPDHADEMPEATARITLQQLLTMTAGLVDDDTFASEVIGQSDWVRWILTQPLSDSAGSFAYSTAGSHLISAILAQATGMSSLDYARARLFDPLGITTTPSVDVVTDEAGIATYATATDFVWPADPTGVFEGGGGQKLTARDMLALGQMWLDDGLWHGQQLVPADWLDQATQHHVDTGDRLASGYGYQFWLTTADGHPAFAALGYGGQVIEIVPDLDLVVVIQSDSPADPRQLADPGTASPYDYVQMVDLIIAPELG